MIKAEYRKWRKNYRSKATGCLTYDSVSKQSEFADGLCGVLHFLELHQYDHVREDGGEELQIAKLVTNLWDMVSLRYFTLNKVLLSRAKNP